MTAKWRFDRCNPFSKEGDFVKFQLFDFKGVMFSPSNFEMPRLICTGVQGAWYNTGLLREAAAEIPGIRNWGSGVVFEMANLVFS